MNTPNNKRKRESQLKIQRAFANLIQEKNLNEITVTEICKITQLNRTTFYANYLDVYDLADKFKEMMSQELEEIYEDKLYKDFDFLKLFKHIKENQLFYKTYFKLNVTELPFEKYNTELANSLYNNEFIDYHIEFFKAGLNAVILKWLASDCKETPETINNIIVSEYMNKVILKEKK
ncbi:MAG: TetR/AcrR family transcriptional regulator [Clostridia bacterium]|nr:TetR/AcrR family transcriptional regulator [Clostridia bacterium]